MRRLVQRGLLGRDDRRGRRHARAPRRREELHLPRCRHQPHYTLDPTALPTTKYGSQCFIPTMYSNYANKGAKTLVFKILIPVFLVPFIGRKQQHIVK